jgi:uncharacterized protein YndB with AHSA1/START domain
LKSVYSEIEIFAPADVVWNIITDPDNYSKWNPFIPRITLETQNMAVGAEFDLDCQMTDTQLLKNEKEVVLAIDPKEFTFRMGTSRERGRPGIVSNRCQICKATGAKTTTYINYEEFRGFLSPMVYFLYSKKLQSAFNGHNMALKEYAEKLL